MNEIRKNGLRLVREQFQAQYRYFHTTLFEPSNGKDSMNQFPGDQWGKILYSSSNIICIMDTEPSRSELYGTRNPYHDIR